MTNKCGHFAGRSDISSLPGDHNAICFSAEGLYAFSNLNQSDPAVKEIYRPSFLPSDLNLHKSFLQTKPI